MLKKLVNENSSQNQDESCNNQSRTMNRGDHMGGWMDLRVHICFFLLSWASIQSDGALGIDVTSVTYTKIGTIQRRLAWPLRKDDTQIREAFHIFSTFNFPVHFPQNSILLKREKIRGEDTSEHRKAGKCWVLRRILQREASAIESQLICGESKSPCGLMDKALDF